MNAVAKGIVLPCPRCGRDEATLRIHLRDMETLTCEDCDEEFSLDLVRNIINKWSVVLKWIDAAPTQDDVNRYKGA